jgi:hypothetical protein
LDGFNPKKSVVNDTNPSVTPLHYTCFVVSNPRVIKVLIADGIASNMRLNQELILFFFGKE